jgi:hypothetical protein
MFAPTEECRSQNAAPLAQVQTPASSNQERTIPDGSEQSAQLMEAESKEAQWT